MSVWHMVRYHDGTITGANVTADWEGRGDATTGVIAVDGKLWDWNWTHMLRLEADSYDDALANAAQAFRDAGCEVRNG